MDANALVQLAMNGGIGAIMLVLYLLANKERKDLTERKDQEIRQHSEKLVELTESSVKITEKMSNLIDNNTKATENNTKATQLLIEKFNDLIRQK